MNKHPDRPNYPTFRMTHYGYELNRTTGQPRLSRQQFYLQCAGDEEFKAAWAPFLDLEYVESADLLEDAPLLTDTPHEKRMESL